jgi:hypothetical protein
LRYAVPTASSETSRRQRPQRNVPRSSCAPRARRTFDIGRPPREHGGQSFVPSGGRGDVGQEPIGRPETGHEAATMTRAIIDASLRCARRRPTIAPGAAPGQRFERTDNPLASMFHAAVLTPATAKRDQAVRSRMHRSRHARGGRPQARVTHVASTVIRGSLATACRSCRPDAAGSAGLGTLRRPEERGCT